ncbi:hypothetical protein BH09PSE1_BH09PSE1_23410 [soil metagenome]
MEVLRDPAPRFGEGLAPCPHTGFPRCARYGLLHTHVIPKDEAGEYAYSDHARDLARRHAAGLWRSFEAACNSGRETLFLRMGGQVSTMTPHPYFQDGAPITGGDFADLVGVLKARYPTLPFRIAFVHHPEYTPFDPAGLPSEVVSCPLPTPPFAEMPPEDHWGGVYSDWDAMFARFGIYPKLLTMAA